MCLGPCLLLTLFLFFKPCSTRKVTLRLKVAPANALQSEQAAAQETRVAINFMAAKEMTNEKRPK